MLEIQCTDGTCDAMLPDAVIEAIVMQRKLIIAARILAGIYPAYEVCQILSKCAAKMQSAKVRQ